MRKLKKPPKRITATLTTLALLLSMATVPIPVTALDPEPFSTPDSQSANFTAFNASDNLNIDVVKVGGADVIKISNPTNTAISTKGLYITNDSNDPFKWQMPAIIIRDEEVIVRSDNDSATPAHKRMQVNFNISGAESIYLFDALGNRIAEWGHSLEKEYLIIPEWGVKFEIPDKITDVRYKIIGNSQTGGSIFFVAKPANSNVEYVEDLEENLNQYAANFVTRSTTHLFFFSESVKIVDLYYGITIAEALTNYSGVYGDTGNLDDENIAYRGITEMYRTIRAIGTQPQKEYLIIEEWGVKFEIPNTVTDVRYFIVNNSTAYMFAKPVGANVEYANGLETNPLGYTVVYFNFTTQEPPEGWLFRRIGDNYFFVLDVDYSFPMGVFGDTGSLEYERMMAEGLKDMFRTIQPIE